MLAGLRRAVFKYLLRNIGSWHYNLVSNSVEPEESYYRDPAARKSSFEFVTGDLLFVSTSAGASAGSR